jgi:hypothetical protein
MKVVRYAIVASALGSGLVIAPHVTIPFYCDTFLSDGSCNPPGEHQIDVGQEAGEWGIAGLALLSLLSITL